MQQAAFDAIGVAARYELWDMAPDDVAAQVARLRDPGYLGANVTIPYKAAVIPYLDAITPQARALAGVVNTITREETPQGVRLIGHNTDAVALVHILDEQQAGRRPGVAHMATADTADAADTLPGDQIGALHAIPAYTGAPGQAGRLLVLGAGGAAQAALGAALLLGMEPWVAARRQAAARDALAALYARQPAERRPPDAAWQVHALDLNDAAALGRALRETRALVNATPVGTRDPDAAPIPLELLRWLPEEAFTLDMVYNPPETAFTRAARALGLRASGGFGMLLYQGAAAFTLWTQQPAPLAVMREALRSSLAHANPA
jgi:shikimate dehydrogenase